MSSLHVELLSESGFDAAFCKAINDHPTYERAYESIETIYEKDFGRRKYASYDSYRRTRSRRIKRNTAEKARKLAISR